MVASWEDLQREADQLAKFIVTFACVLTGLVVIQIVLGAHG